TGGQNRPENSGSVLRREGRRGWHARCEDTRRLAACEPPRGSPGASKDLARCVASSGMPRPGGARGGGFGRTVHGGSEACGYPPPAAAFLWPVLVLRGLSRRGVCSGRCELVGPLGCQQSLLGRGVVRSPTHQRGVPLAGDPRLLGHRRFRVLP